MCISSMKVTKWAFKYILDDLSKYTRLDSAEKQTINISKHLIIKYIYCSD